MYMAGTISKRRRAEEWGPYGPNRMRYWRKRNHMSLEQVGEALEEAGVDVGTSHAQLGRIERGEQPYNQQLLQGLSKLYGVRVTSLLEVGIEEELGDKWEVARNYLDYLINQKDEP